MKTATKLFLSSVAYLSALMLCLGTSVAAIFAVPHLSLHDVSHPLMLAICMALAVPISIHMIYPGLRSIYYQSRKRGKATSRLTRAIRRFGNQIPSSGAAVFVLRNDEALTLISASPGFWTLVGMRAAEFRSQYSSQLSRLVCKEDVDAVRASILGEQIILPIIDFRLDTGSTVIWCRLFGVREEYARTGLTVVNCIAVNISDFKSIERELYLEKERYRFLLSNMTNAIWEYRADTDQLFLSNRHVSNGEFIEVPDFRSSLIKSGDVHPDRIGVFIEFCKQLKEGACTVSSELLLRNHAGSYRRYNVFGKAIFDNVGVLRTYVGQIKSVTGDVQGIERFTQDSDYDTLTRLNTRYSFEGLVSTLISDNGKRAASALFVIDVDDFLKINSNLGRLFGDALLIELSEALKSVFPRSSVFSRTAGDEFAVFLENYTSEEQLLTLASEVCGCVSHCFLNLEQTKSVTCSVGIARYPHDAKSFEKLYFFADSALLSAKRHGKNTYCVYNAELGADVAEDVYDRSAKWVERKMPDAMLKDDDLLTQAVDILFESRELSSSINLIIALIGRRFKLDRVSVVEFTKDSQFASLTYSWYSEAERSRDTVLKSMAIPIELALSRILCSVREEYYLCNDISALSDSRPDITAFCRSFGARALLQCPVLDGLELRGCVTYTICHEDGVFLENDIAEILLISKIIISYLVHLRTKQDIDRITFYDKLTGAMNYTAFKTEAETILKDAGNQKYAVVYSDVDRFKFINETYGYKVGDDILITFARIYEQFIEPGELFARIEGDKFVALLRYDRPEDIIRRIEELHERVNHIKKTDAAFYHLPVRSGVYYIAPDEKSISSVVDKSNLARKSVKNIHVSTIAVFDESLKNRIIRQKDIEDVMLDALRNEEFIVYYQPKFSLSSNDVAGAEALVRWKRSSGGRLLKPDDFIPIFEDNGFVIELDFYVLEQVCIK